MFLALLTQHILPCSPTDAQKDKRKLAKMGLRLHQLLVTELYWLFMKWNVRISDENTQKLVKIINRIWRTYSFDIIISEVSMLTC